MSGDGTRLVGQPLARVDGPLKVTGKARYSAEFSIPDLAHAVLVQSPVGRGKVRSVETEAAEHAPGVLAVLTRRNAPPLKRLPDDITGPGKPGEWRAPLEDDVIHYAGQHLGIVVAGTLEQARHAAELVRVDCDSQKAAIDPRQPAGDPIEPEKLMNQEELRFRLGDAGKALRSAPVRVEQTYETPVLHHNPIEMAATIAAWDGGRLTLHDTTRWLLGVRKMVSHMLGMPADNLHVICPYLGGAFGSKGFLWGHVALAALAARHVRRPVKLVLSRAQMFTSEGRRPRTFQTMALGADRDGKLTALRHATLGDTSPVSGFVEPCGLVSRNLYACPNVEVTHRSAPVNAAPPTFMRAPGEASGTFALESALDELAVALRIDPVELRLRNYAEADQHRHKPYSSKHLKECYERGAERFGWKQRNPTPGSMRDRDLRVGWGMATAFYPQRRQPASAKAVLSADGQAVVSSATHDVGAGVYTVMTQLAADALGLPQQRVRFELGDSWLASAPVTGGSWTTVSVGPAVVAAAEAVKQKLVRLAITNAGSRLHGAAEGDVVAGEGKLFVKGDPARSDTYADILRRAGQKSVEAEGKFEPGPEQDRFSFESFGAQFAEVKIDPLGQVRVTRFVGVFDTGKVLNPRTARSQFIGGITMGIGMALMEGTVYDPRTAKVVNDSLADYHVPVNRDVPDIDATFVDRPDPHIGPAGAHGVGEIGITGVAAAVANAVFHATGKRIRDLPITPEKLL